MKKNNVRLGFIGVGNMGTAIATALLRQKAFSPSAMGFCDVDQKRVQSFCKKFKATPFKTNLDLASRAEIIFLAVKPQQMGEVLAEIGPVLSKKLVISIAAGLDSIFFKKFLPRNTRFIRAMPNMAAMIGEGMTGIYAAPAATKSDKALAFKIFNATGKTIAVDREDLLDAVTAVSGSGPAFVFYFIESLLQSAHTLGLPVNLAKTLVFQTMSGSVKLAEGSLESLSTLIQRVASKGGTTEAGLKVLKRRRGDRIIHETLQAAQKRAAVLRRAMMK